MIRIMWGLIRGERDVICRTCDSRISQNGFGQFGANSGHRGSDALTDYLVDPETRQTVLPTSSATSNAPRLSITTPTGRPIASPFGLTKPVSTSIGIPEGFPPVNGTKITL